ncbi:uncharacterized protein Z518_04659 [Rhinocladiella mackenziei CBS 650.93]|uniref:Peroxin-20 n=1 Tax=Rhinocladiella mackenziei CBS 650.93 TaxID=1442369 RepID=A0A0D2H8B5_9EURO|nr:uncharacterized protein Z518_04659 [Rhinocladiella mackenziei CBS 650.93]KIX06683.1 hypothetical protein Z518_04659 [Rhinocladiella mackenziei CBS 650.93]
MADALCGPSNPLQNLQKHTQIDRTLQQDRLVGPRQSPGQGFRSADPRAGSLDADFHAFENAAPNSFQFQQPGFADTLPAFHSRAHAHVQPATASAGWAADFQRLNIHDHPLPAGQFRTEAPLVRSTVGGWQDEFMRQRSSVRAPSAQGNQIMAEPPGQINTNMFTSQARSPMLSYAQSVYQSFDGFQGQQPHQHRPVSMDQQVQISDVDFEAAFADVSAHAQEMDRQQPHNKPSETIETTIEQRETTTIRIGSDAIHYREQSERTPDQDMHDADELARTAGQLLSSVQHDTSTKFQNSQFLDLMRRIRDREVEVQNNDLQSVGTGMAAVTGTTTSDMDMASTSTSDLERHEDQLNLDQQRQGREANVKTKGKQPATTSHFEFPDMDAVYAPSMEPKASKASSLIVPPYTTYGFDDDQYPAMQPQTQIEALHPGGKWYPDQSPRLRRAEMEMSGAIVDDGSVGDDDDGATLEKRISASDFEYVDENAGLARRFVRPGEMT